MSYIHAGMNRDAAETLKKLKEVAGQQYIITPGFPEPWRKDKDTVLRYLEVFNHVKDDVRKPGGGERGQGYESTVLGTGKLKLAEIVRLGRHTGGTKYFIAEQESSQGMPELECARRDGETISSCGRCRDYSLLNALTGLAKAARTVCTLRVMTAIAVMAAPPARKTHQLTAVR